MWMISTKLSTELFHCFSGVFPLLHIPTAPTTVSTKNNSLYTLSEGNDLCKGAFQLTDIGFDVGCDITLGLAEEALKDIISPNAQREVTPNLIIQVVSDHFGITPLDNFLSELFASGCPRIGYIKNYFS